MCQQNSAAPNTPHEIPYLALFRQPKGPFKPSTFGKIESSFTNTSSIEKSLKIVKNFSNNFCCVTDGKNGVYYLNKNELVQVKPPKINAIDTLDVYSENTQLSKFKSAFCDDQNNIWVADSINGLIKITSGGIESTILPNGPSSNNIFD